MRFLRASMSSLIGGILFGRQFLFCCVAIGTVGLEDFRDPEMARSCVWGLIEREFLAERWSGAIVSGGICLFAFARKSTNGRLDVAGGHFIQLLDISNDIGHLGRKDFEFFWRDLHVGQLGDLLNVGFCNGHLFTFEWVVCLCV